MEASAFSVKVSLGLSDFAFIVNTTIVSLKAKRTIQSHLEETIARMIFYTYIREYKQQQFYKYMQDQQGQ